MKQIYPASITGKGSRFAEGGSFLDHAFGKGDPYTLGAEEEYMPSWPPMSPISRSHFTAWR